MRFFIYTSFYFFCGIINNFSTEEKQEEKIKCCSCEKIVITITKNNKNGKNDEPNYTIKAPFASLSCIFDCKCNSFFLCKSCCKNIKNCPKCKNNEEQSKKNTNNDYNDLSCEICTITYINIKLASCSYFYNCICNELICKKCYEECIKKNKKCPFCRQIKDEENNHNVTNEENNHNVTNKENNHNVTNEENIINEEQKNCCQICIEWIKDC